MKRNFTLSFFLVLISLSTVLSKNVLTINNPQNFWWEFGQGTIEEATFVIEPKGVYMEVGMILTLSARDQWWGAGDTLEAVLDFSLPSEAIIHDSWLWIDDDIVKAEVMDIWSASATYDAIVSRNRDPSILYQKSDGGFQIRIFPMDGADVRKIKITYLVPTVWTHETVSTSLPLEILQTSYHPLSKFTVITIPDSNWENPKFKEYPNLQWINGVDAQFGDILIAEFSGNDLGKPLTFETNAPLEDGVFFSQSQIGGDNFYQMAYLPETVSIDYEPQKLTFLIEYYDFYTTFEPQNILNEIKDHLLKKLSEKDSFNLIFLKSPTDFYYAAQDWIPADSLNIESVFSNLPDIHQASKMDILLEEGINFIQNQGGDGEIVFFGCNENYNSSWYANILIESLFEKMNNKVLPIHIFDYQTYFEYDFWGQPWWDEPNEFPVGNDYVYTNLSRLTGGNYYPSAKGNCGLWEGLSDFFLNKKSVSMDYDFHLSPTNGFSFNDYSVKYLGQSNMVNQSIIQIGKFYGEAPFSVELASFINGNFNFEEKNIQPDQIIEGDTLLREMWYGHHIWDLSAGNPNNALVENIIKTSIEERVLSPYTAFLALEPSFGGEICFGCWEVEDIIFPVETTEKQEEIVINVFPNPFTDYVTFEFEESIFESPKEGTIEIFDAQGRLISSLKIQNQTSFTWNVQNDLGQKLTAGIYYAVIRIDDKVARKKLIHIN